MRHLSVVALLLGIGSAGAQQNVTTIKSLRMKILSKMNPKVPPSTGPGPWAEGWGEGNQVKVLVGQDRYSDSSLNCNDRCDKSNIRLQRGR